jgi:hypothetical protein
MKAGRKDHLNDDERERLDKVVDLLQKSGCDFMIQDISGSLLKVSIWIGDQDGKK